MLKSIICKICSNGCNVKATVTGNRVTISGHQCKKGYKLLKAKLLKDDTSCIICDEYSSVTTLPESPEKLLNLWGITYTKECAHRMIQGSPERSLFRTVIEDKKGSFYILEEIEKKSITKKEKIARRLQELKKLNLKVITYCSSNNRFVQKYKGRYWLCQPYLQNEALSRSDYWKSSSKGDQVAQFLIELKSASSNFKRGKSDTFSLQRYIKNLLKTIKKSDKETFRKLKPLKHLLEEQLYPLYDDLPESFSHGDPHPLNMIWQNDEIAAVIDWEFSGFRPRLYDVALILGCVGSESEEALNEAFINAFLNTLLEESYLTKKEWQNLPLFVVAQRFAWLSEWLRRNDNEMVDFELFYMRYLLQWKPPQISQAQQISTDKS